MSTDRTTLTARGKGFISQSSEEKQSCRRERTVDCKNVTNAVAQL